MMIKKLYRVTYEYVQTAPFFPWEKLSAKELTLTKIDEAEIHAFSRGDAARIIENSKSPVLKITRVLKTEEIES